MKFELDPLYDITSNIPGPVDSDVKKWNGDVKSAWLTFFSIKKYVPLPGGDGVFMPDMSAFRAARDFLEEKLGSDTFSRMIKNAEERLS
jgi:hypothetical protein